VDVGVVPLVIPDQRVNDRPGLLAAGRAVKVDQRMAVDLLIEDREIATQPG
jgi:hypothetical protein